MHTPYVLYDARLNQIQSCANLTRDEARRLNGLIPKSNFSQPYLIWILLPAFWDMLSH